MLADIPALCQVYNLGALTGGAVSARCSAASVPGGRRAAFGQLRFSGTEPDPAVLLSAAYPPGWSGPRAAVRSSARCGPGWCGAAVSSNSAPPPPSGVCGASATLGGWQGAVRPSVRTWQSSVSYRPGGQVTPPRSHGCATTSESVRSTRMEVTRCAKKRSVGAGASTARDGRRGPRGCLAAGRRAGAWGLAGDGSAVARQGR